MPKRLVSKKRVFLPRGFNTKSYFTEFSAQGGKIFISCVTNYTAMHYSTHEEQKKTCK
jgi:hypothetical protein